MWIRVELVLVRSKNVRHVHVNGSTRATRTCRICELNCDIIENVHTLFTGNFFFISNPYQPSFCGIMTPSVTN